MLGDHFYNKTIHKAITIFGNVFNNITVRRQAANSTLNFIKVPLAYGPTEKFLSRISELKNDEDTANGKSAVMIQLPRMSFQIESMTFDPAAKLNRLNRRIFPIAGNDLSYNTTWQSVPYNLEVSLSIMARTQDEALQIVEQIIPYFTPEYTVSVKGIEGPDTRTDVPIVLTSMNIPIDYEGSFETRRVIIYTLTFSMKVRFTGPISPAKKILDVDVDFIDIDDHSIFFEEISVIADSENDPDIDITISPLNDES